MEKEGRSVEEEEAQHLQRAGRRRVQSGQWSVRGRRESGVRRERGEEVKRVVQQHIDYCKIRTLIKAEEVKEEE